MTTYEERKERAAQRVTHAKADRTAYRVVVVTAILASALSAVAFMGTAYAIIHQQLVATNLCKTINATRGPDVGTGFNTRQEYRDLWIALGRHDRAAAVPEARKLDCNTGKPSK